MMNNFAASHRMMRVLFVLLCSAAIHSSLGQQRDVTTRNRTRRSSLKNENRLHIGSVLPGKSVLLMEIARAHYYVESDHPGCVVSNIGKKPFHAKLISGSMIKWNHDSIISQHTFVPGETKRLAATGAFAATILEITNKADVKGIFYAHRGTAPRGINQLPQPPNVIGFESAIVKIFKIFVNVQLVGNAYNHNFAAGVAAEMLSEVLFPQAKEDPWKEIKKKVEVMLNSATLVIINAILENDIKPQKAKIQNMVSLINNPLVHDIYMSQVHELVGYETKFYFSSSGIKNEEVNLHILPLYVRTVNMKVALYTFGMTYQKELGLSVNEVDLIAKYRQNLVKDAIAHVERAKREKLEYEYNNMNPNFFYDKLMRTRTQAAVHGEEYFTYWKQVIDPENNPKINNTIMTYSDYFGVSTPSLYKLAWVHMGRAPLTPGIVQVSSDEVRRIALQSMDVHYHGTWRRLDVICGIVLKFEDGVEHKLGSFGYKNSNFNLRGNKIESLEVKGNTNVIDCLNFTLTDKSSRQFGHNCNPLRTTFKLKDHYIASLFASKDNGRRDGRFVNIAVSYQLMDTVNVTELTPQPKED